MRRLLALSFALALASTAGNATPTGAGTPNPDPCGPGSGGRAVAFRDGRVFDASGAPDACLYHTGYNAAEPTIGFTKKGSLFVQAMDGNTWPVFPEHFIRSTDGGRSWKDMTPTFGPNRRHSYSEDPYLYVDPETSRIFATDYLLPCYETSFSDDDGRTWTTVVNACDIFDHATIFAGKPVFSPTVGYPNIIYLCAIDGGAATYSTATSCEKSLDGGVTFERTGSPAFTDDPREPNGNSGIPGNCVGANGHAAAGADGTIYLPRGWCGQPYLAISHDEGATWTRVQVAKNGMNTTADGSDVEHEASVVVDAKGDLYYTWVALDRQPYLAVSRDGGKTWNKPERVSPPGVKEAALPSIAVGGVGKIALLFMGSTNSPGGPPWHENKEKAYKDVTWNGYLSITANALDAHPTFWSAPVNAPNQPLLRGACGPGRCQAEYDFLDVKIGPDGTAYGVFVNECYKGTCQHDGPYLPNVGEAVIGRLVGGSSLQ